MTDHGFFLNAQAEAGDVCVKPQGNWLINAHDRMMLGDGNADTHNMVMSAEKLGMRGDAARVALPRSMAPCRGAVAQPPRVRRADAPVGTGPVRVKPEDDRLAALGGAQLSRPEYPSQSPTHHADTKISPIILKCSVSITPREKSGAIPGAVSGSVKNRSFFGRPPRALDSVSRDTE